MKNILLDRDSFAERFSLFLSTVGITAYQLSKQIDVSEAILSNIKNSKSMPGSEVLAKILKHYEVLNLNWLITGNGNMLLTNQAPSELPKYLVTGAGEKLPKRPRGIPLIPIEAMGGAGSGDFSVEDYDVDQFWVMPEFKQADFLIRVRGDSMMPLYNNGDFVICKFIKDRQTIEWGRAYVIDSESGAYIKYVEEGKDDEHIYLTSENTKYKRYQIPIASIRAIALVMGVVRWD